MSRRIKFILEDDEQGENFCYTICCSGATFYPDLVEKFKTFSLAMGFLPQTVNNLDYNQESMDIIRDRIKSALDSMSAKDYESAKRYLEDAYDGERE